MKKKPKEVSIAKIGTAVMSWRYSPRPNDPKDCINLRQQFSRRQNLQPELSLTDLTRMERHIVKVTAFCCKCNKLRSISNNLDQYYYSGLPITLIYNLLLYFHDLPRVKLILKIRKIKKILKEGINS
jgi:hypothetical protein